MLKGGDWEHGVRIRNPQDIEFDKERGEGRGKTKKRKTNKRKTHKRNY